MAEVTVCVLEEASDLLHRAMSLVTQLGHRSCVPLQETSLTLAALERALTSFSHRLLETLPQTPPTLHTDPSTSSSSNSTTTSKAFGSNLSAPSDATTTATTPLSAASDLVRLDGGDDGVSGGHDDDVSMHTLEGALAALKARAHAAPVSRGGLGGADSMLFYISQALATTIKSLSALQRQEKLGTVRLRLTRLLGMSTSLLLSQKGGRVSRLLALAVGVVALSVVRRIAAGFTRGRRIAVLCAAVVYVVRRQLHLWVLGRALDDAQRRLLTALRLWIIVNYILDYTQRRKDVSVEHTTLIARPHPHDHVPSRRWKGRQMLEAVPPHSDLAFWYQHSTTMALFGHVLNVAYSSFGVGCRAAHAFTAPPSPHTHTTHTTNTAHQKNQTQECMSGAHGHGEEVHEGPIGEHRMGDVVCNDNSAVHNHNGERERQREDVSAVGRESGHTPSAAVMKHDDEHAMKKQDGDDEGERDDGGDVIAAEEDPLASSVWAWRLVGVPAAAASALYYGLRPGAASRAACAATSGGSLLLLQRAWGSGDVWPLRWVGAQVGRLLGLRWQKRVVVDGVSCYLLSPHTDGPPENGSSVIIFCHGGGFISHLFLPDMPVLCSWARAACADVVVLPEYTLAPSARFPTPPHELLKVYSAMLQGQLGFTPTRIVVSGESAGGNLAASLVVSVLLEVDKSNNGGLLPPGVTPHDDTLASIARVTPHYGILHCIGQECMRTEFSKPKVAREKRAAKPCSDGSGGKQDVPSSSTLRVPEALVLFYPVLNFCLSPSPSRAMHMADPVLPMGVLSTITHGYLPKPPDPLAHDPSKDPRLSPYFAHASILQRFPPTFIGVGGFDPLLDDTVDFEARLRRLGVPCEVRVGRALPHGFFGMYGIDRTSTDMIDEAGLFMHKALDAAIPAAASTHVQYTGGACGVTVEAEQCVRTNGGVDRGLEASTMAAADRPCASTVSDAVAILHEDP